MSNAERDNPDLEALFDSIADARDFAPPGAPSKPAATKAASTKAAVAKATVPTPVKPEPVPANPEAAVDHLAGTPPMAVLSAANAALAADGQSGQEELISRIGHLTRSLHDSLRELGYDKAIEHAAAAIPDTRDRLAYVANLTGDAANKVLTLTETALPLQEAMGTQARNLSGRWQALFDNRLSVSEFEALVAHTRTYLDAVPTHASDTSRCLRDIMVAQDFHDLTGQVIRKITDMAHRMEAELVTLLIENVSPETRAEAMATNGLMNGPVISADGRADVVTTQAQVDDLLATLGF